MRKMLTCFLYITLIFQLIPRASAQTQNNMSISANIPPKPTDYSVAISQIDPIDTTLNENSTITYKITYGTSLSYTSNFEVVASWTQGAFGGDPNPSIDVVTYDSSGNGTTNGYGDTPPIVNTVNRTIVWNLTNVPANTQNQTITFRLKTLEPYNGPKTIYFYASAHIYSDGVSANSVSILNAYRHSAPGPTPTSAPNTPTPIPTTAEITPTPPIATPVPSTAPEALKFTNIDIAQKSSKSAEITIASNKDTVLTLNYGLSPTNLSGKKNTNVYSKSTNITLDGLTSATDYYFTVKATTVDGESATSDIYTFTTANQSLIPEINVSTLIATSQNKVLFEPTAVAVIGGSNTIVIPQNTQFEIKFSLTHNDNIKRITLYVQPKSVLGANTESNEHGMLQQSGDLVEIQPGVFYGKLTSELKSGYYDLIARIEDVNGNIVQKKIAEIKVIAYMTIINERNYNPVEHARVYFTVYDYTKRQFIAISPASLAIENPSYSNSDGKILTVLPPGIYRAKIDAVGYNSKEITFVIGSREEDGFPEVKLKPLNFTAGVIFQQLSSTGSDLASWTTSLLQSSAISPRTLFFLNSIIVALFVILSVFATSARFSIRIINLPFYAWYHSSRIFKRNLKLKGHILQGIVVDRESGFGLANAIVYIHNKRNMIVAHTLTNKFGEFYLRVPKLDVYKITASKRDYKLPHNYFFTLAEAEKRLTLHIHPNAKPLTLRSLSAFWWYIRYASGSFLEVLLIICLLLEFIFARTFSLIAVFPFLIASVLNIFLWLFYMRHRREHEE